MNTRRSFLKRAAAVVAACALPFVPRVARAVHGPRYVAGDPSLPPNIRVYLDGKEITNVANECDVAEGWANIYPHEFDADGRLQLIGATTYRTYGVVEVSEG